MNLLHIPFLEAVEDATGGNPKLQTGDYQSVGRFPIVDQGQKFIAGYTDDESALCNRTGDVIVFGDHTKAFKFIDFDFVLGADGVKVLRPKSGFDARYLFHYLQTVRLPENLGYSRHFKYLKECVVPKPSIEEQKRIAAILDKADSVRRKRQQAIHLADDFLRAVFLDIFGDPESNPKHWPTTRLDEISLQITDGEHQTPQRSNEGIYLLSARNVQDGRLDFGDVDYVPHAEYERIRKRCEPVRGDVLISCSGSIGRVAQINVDVPLTLVRSVALVRPDPTKVRSGFLEYLLRTPSLQRAMQKASKSSAQANLFQAPIRALTAILPPISLQDKFEQIRLQTLKARKKLSESCDEHQAFCAAIQNTYF